MPPTGPTTRRTARPATTKKPAATTAATKRTAAGTSAAATEAEEGSVRLHVLLARAGVASRREAERLIADGEVQVNGRVVTEAGARAREGVDHVRVSGRLVQSAAVRRYFAYHKPVGCVSTMRDPEGRFCIGDVCAALGARGLFPVGRLDWNSSGLILLTSDGALAELLMHPRFHVERRYAVKVKPRPRREEVEALREGIRIGRERTAPAYVRETSHADGKAWFDVRIAEGRNQQVRRMFEAVGCRVEKLRRDAIGPLVLGGLPVGQARPLDSAEVAELRAAAEGAGSEAAMPRRRAPRPRVRRSASS